MFVHGEWASLIAQLVKNLPAMQETWVQFLGWEDPLEKEMAIHSNILAWNTPMGRGVLWTTVHGVKRVGHDLPIKPHGVRKCSSFIFLHAVDQFSQQCLLKRLSCLHCIFLPPLSQINRP